MKIIFVGDSPVLTTGFAKCSRTACDALHAAGHDVIALGMGYYGDPHTLPYPIYPCFAPLESARSYGGESRLPLMIAQHHPDVVVILQDPWNIPQYFECIDAARRECESRQLEYTVPPIVGWLAVDSESQKGEQIDRLSHVMVWAEFARRELIFGGCRPDMTFDLVTLGVDIDTFFPQDKVSCRRTIGFDAFGIPTDAFIVGVVGRNQPRKQLVLSLSYFAEWITTHDVHNAYLYMHVAPTGEQSCDLRKLVKYFGLSGRVIVATPEVGTGCAESTMAQVYNSFDVYMTQSQGEGFGLPALEAMACGVPCLLPEHSAFGVGGWVRDGAALLAKCDNVAVTAPLSAGPYTVGKLANRSETVWGLDVLYRHPNVREFLSSQGRELAESLTWRNTGKSLVVSLERFMHVLHRKTEEIEEGDASRG